MEAILRKISSLTNLLINLQDDINDLKKDNIILRQQIEDLQKELNDRDIWKNCNYV